MARGQKDRRALPRARGNCKHFEGALAHCARGGLTAVVRAHTELIDGGSKVVCSINLDSCRRAAEPGASRWDYILIIGSGTGPGLAMEVHHAAATEVQPMIKKMQWANALLKAECPSLVVKAWKWIVPKGQEPFFTPNDPQAKILAQSGIDFPRSSLTII
jgi:hypothetical protein